MLGLTAVAGVAFYLLLLVGQAPHLVHHVFERGAPGTECPLATSGERTAGSVVAVVVVPHAELLGPLAAPEGPPAARCTAHALADPRAPPRLAS
ncbi:MAG TPA: hypothetical protein VFX28_00680 [Methylomirabilota bacterium]|nr:hypothetical protein [Methylomirabilota bacterium]